MIVPQEVLTIVITSSKIGGTRNPQSPKEMSSHGSGSGNAQGEVCRTAFVFCPFIFPDVALIWHFTGRA